MELLTSDKTVSWYAERPQLSPAARQLLVKYSKVPAEQVENHVVNIREAAWEIFPYPCIGRFRFLDLGFAKSAEYPEVLKRLHEGQRLLDIGCCFGQAIRQLVSDGAPSENLYGSDLRGEYIELGYDLFRDKDTLKSTFITANILDATSTLNKVKGEFDLVFAGSFFHLWGYEDQVKVSKLVVALLRPQKGSMIVGRQVGTVNGFQPGHAPNTMGQMFQHNVESFKKMWKGIGEDIGVTFAVDAKLEMQPRLPDPTSNDVRRISFTVRRE
jgi:SAM-dependent methyltransferase